LRVPASAAALEAFLVAPVALLVLSAAAETTLLIHFSNLLCGGSGIDPEWVDATDPE
jgi:hypothetical protein